MRMLVLIAAAAALSSGAAAAKAADAGPMSTINRFVDSFNKGDIAGAKATHAADVVITDEIAPFHWRGPKAFDTWLGDLTAHDAKQGVTNETVKLGKVRRQEISGDHGYVIVSATYAYKQKGTPMAEPAEMVFSLTSGADGWKINSWAWSGTVPKAAAK